jgi:hypothetical protein
VVVGMNAARCDVNEAPMALKIAVTTVGVRENAAVNEPSKNTLKNLLVTVS